MFITIHFLFFLVVTLFFYYSFRISWRPAILCVASWLFCMAIDKKAFVVLLGVTIVSFVGGLILEKWQYKGMNSLTMVLFGGIVAGYLFIFFLHPGIGVSFYLFQAIGYLTDVRKGRSEAEKNFIYLALYFAFFAKFISGPIERIEDFIPQLKNLEIVKFWNRGRISLALTNLLWGGFMKMVIADRLALPIGVIFETPNNFDSVQLILGAIAYAFQIYCDFAGYSYMVIGIALLFGIELIHNFEMPYTATSISAFWRKWHISLSSWLRDYVYIPMGGNRKGVVRKCFNTMVVFTVCGIWHGRSFSYLFWGILHGSYMVIDTLWKNNVKRKLPDIVGKILTFGAVAFAWIFFRVSGLRTGILYVVTMFTAGVNVDCWIDIAKRLSLNGVEIAIILSGICIVSFIDILCKKKGEHLPELVQHEKNHIRYIIFYALFITIFLFGIYGPGYHASDFIYMQF